MTDIGSLDPTLGPASHAIRKAWDHINGGWEGDVLVTVHAGRYSNMTVNAPVGRVLPFVREVVKDTTITKVVVGLKTVFDIADLK